MTPKIIVAALFFGTIAPICAIHSSSALPITVGVAFLETVERTANSIAQAANLFGGEIDTPAPVLLPHRLQIGPGACSRPLQMTE